MSRRAPSLPPPADPAQALRGSSLTEALLACVLLGLGMAAWLRLQGVTARELAAARARHEAALAASNLAAALHAQQACCGDVAARLALRRTLLPLPLRPALGCREHDCSPEQMLEQDLYRWGRMAAERLPGARAELECAGAVARAGRQSRAACTLRMRLAAPAGVAPALLEWRLHP